MVPEIIKPFAEACAALIEILGVSILTGTCIYVIVYAIVRGIQRKEAERIYETCRQRLGRGILFGLEFLVAADIIHTVAVELTYQTVTVLAIIVVIRTFLSFTIDVELNGKWPWQEGKKKKSDAV